MQKTPPRPNLFTDTSIQREVTLQYLLNGKRNIMEVDGPTLSDAATELLNDPSSGAYLSVALSPGDPTNAPYVKDYYIKKFLITDYHQNEQILEVRLEPWSNGPMTSYGRTRPPIYKVVSTPQTTQFISTTVWIVTLHDGQRSRFSIDANVRLNLQLKTIDL